MTIKRTPPKPTDLEAFVQWLDGLDFLDGWEPVYKIITAKGMYVIRVEPCRIDDKPVRFDRENEVYG